MTDRPILFSGPMVQALIAGRKTQTRRPIKPRDIYEDISSEACEDFELKGWNCFRRGGAICAARHRINQGDRLWVREHWHTNSSEDSKPPHEIDAGEFIWYVADGEMSMPTSRFRQAMHMPRWASRITLLVENVRVERLQDISEEDAIAEGIWRNPHGKGYHWVYYTERSSAAGWLDPIMSYKFLWNSINGEKSWDANPWVAVYSFSVILKNIDEVTP